MCFISVVHLFRVRGRERKQNNKYQIHSFLLVFTWNRFFLLVQNRASLQYRLREKRGQTNEKLSKNSINLWAKNRRAKKVRITTSEQSDTEEACSEYDANDTIQPSIFIWIPPDTRSIRPFSRFKWILSQAYGARFQQSVPRCVWTIVRYTRSSSGRWNISWLTWKLSHLKSEKMGRVSLFFSFFAPPNAASA